MSSEQNDHTVILGAGQSGLAAGYYLKQRGVVPEAPGLSFLGLLYQTGLTSSLLGGVGEDAKYFTTQIMKRQ